MPGKRSKEPPKNDKKFNRLRNWIDERLMVSELSPTKDNSVEECIKGINLLIDWNVDVALYFEEWRERGGRCEISLSDF